MRRNPIRPIKIPSRLSCGRLSRRSGFTIIELLTVIAIIVILAAILLPAASKVRQQALVALTKQEISKISGAIDQYYLEFNHTYPGPISNADIGKGMITFGPDFSDPAMAGATPVTVTSTENLTLGLLGGLQFAPNTSTPVVYNSKSILSGLGPLNLSSNIARQTRHAPFIAATPGQDTPSVIGGTSPVPAPWYGGPGKIGALDSAIPEFMDKFNSYHSGPRPILYVRASIGNPVHDAQGRITQPDDKTTQYNNQVLYAYADEQAILVNGSQNPPRYKKAPDFGFSIGECEVNGATVTFYSSWSAYLGNPNDLTTPRGVNAYILISAGLDGVYGTTDDILYP